MARPESPLADVVWASGSACGAWSRPVTRGGAMAVADSGRPPFDVVAIGSSAGGIEALPIVTGTLLPPLPAAVLIVQHLHPHHPTVPPHLLRPPCPLEGRP